MRNHLVPGLLALLFVPGLSPAAETGPPPDVKCGAYCAFVGLKALGLVDGPYSAFEKTIAPPGPSGYSMEDLDRIAVGRGAATLAVEADLEALATLSRPNACIAFVDQHFLIISWVNLDTKTVSLIDPPRTYDQPFDKFRKRFSKRSLVLGPPLAPPTLARSTSWAALVGWSSAAVACLILLGGLLARISKRSAAMISALIVVVPLSGCGAKAGPTPPTYRAVAGLKIEPADRHVGKVFASTPDHKTTRETRLSNESAAPIRLLEVRKSCNCTSVDLGATTIAAGGSTTLKSTFAVGSLPGPSRVQVELVTDAKDSASRTISYDWDVVTPMFAEVSPCDFGRLEPTQPTERRIALRDRGLILCPDCRLAADPNHSLIGARVEVERTPDGPGHPARIDHPGPERRLGSMLVSIRPGGDPGDYHQGVTVTLRCGGIDRAKLDLPVDWSVRPSIEAQPSRLWLGAHRSSAQVSRRIALRSNDGSPLNVERVTSEPPDLLAESKVSAEPDGSLAIDLIFAIRGDPGIRRGALTISQGVEKPRPSVVPVSYLIQPPVSADEVP